ncbi:MAG TPA: MFS transporter [Opitutaceae bacterium]|nr:MFS transporter [Opitutaceae bacterium]
MASTSSPSETPHDPYAALRVPAYRRYLIGNTLANIGRQGLGLVATWQVYRWTESATALGLVGLVNFLPYIVLALPAGHLADRVNRRRLIQVTLAGSAVVSLLLAAVSAWPEQVPDWTALHWFNEGLLWCARLGRDAGQVSAAGFERPALAAVFLLLLLDQTIRTLGTPARASIVPMILPRGLIASAITWNSSSFELTAMLGPTLAGFLIAGFGFPAVYLLDAVLAFAMVGLLQGINYREPEQKPEPRTWHTLGAGAGFIWRNKEILAASGLDLFAVLLGGAVALLPVYADKILHVGPIGLSWLRAAPSIGAVLMAMWLTHSRPMRRPGATMLWAVAGFGVVITIFGLSRWYWLSFAMLFLSGCLDNVSVVVRQSLVQLLTPDRLRGRVTAVNQIFIISSNEVGAFRAGTMAGAFGPVVAVVAGGVGTVLVVLGMGALFPQLARLGQLHELKPRE